MNETPAVPPSPEVEGSLNEQISHRRRILAVLDAMKDGRALLSARIENQRGYFNTTLLKIDAEKGYVFLDELAPADGHEKIAVGQTLHLYGFYNNLPAHFAIEVIHVGEHEGIAFYAGPLPKLIHYQQKRAHFRAYVGLGKELKVRLRKGDGAQISGRLQDISLGGFGALMPADSVFEDLEIVEVQALELPDHHAIACSAEIRHSHPTQGRVHIGARFTQLAPQAERQLLQAIVELEREQLRKQSRD
ncbi:flagellar brake protein [Thioalkalivibrio sulfidiphilus]|uniref:flagellar brake protein n=1 Tax=Thioalkalivibrio sulfidiphilus TaxID=1033854 RepID=UPI003B36824B